MYKLKLNGIIRLSDNASIPLDPGNPDYQDYMAWIAAGNTPLPEFTPEEQAAREAQAAAAAEEQEAILAVRAHQKLTALKDMTPAQVEQWVNTHVTNLTQAKEVLATLAVAVSVLARRL